MKKIAYILACCILLSSCQNMINMKRDIELTISGQFYVEQDGELTPYKNLVFCDFEWIMNSNVAFGTACSTTWERVRTDNNGYLFHEIEATKNTIVNLHAVSNPITDTTVYILETTLSFKNNYNQTDLKFPLHLGHRFDETLTPHTPKRGEKCTFAINHDCLTSIELFYRDYYGGGEDIPFWQSKVDNEKSFTFTFPEYPEDHKSIWFYIRFTTLHYGTYVSSVFSSY